jgi:hypothetical protein
MHKKPFNYLHNTIFEAIDAADNNGYLTFEVPSQNLPHLRSLRPRESLRELVLKTFEHHPLFTLRLRRMPRAEIARIDASYYTNPETQDWTITLRLSKLMLLPGVNHSQELADMRALFEHMREYFTGYAQVQKDACISFENTRGPRNSIRGHIRCLPEKSEQGRDTGAELQACIDASPSLTYFQRQHAYELQKFGDLASTELSGTGICTRDSTAA